MTWRDAGVVTLVMWSSMAIVPGLFALGEIVENALKKRRRQRDFPRARVM